MTVDTESGWHIIQLSAENRREPKKSIMVKITPEGGANLFAFRVGDADLILGPEKLVELDGKHLGMFILYPTPNRIRDGVYTFRGEKYTMTFPGETRTHKGHGIVWDDAWTFDEPRAGANSASCTVRYVLDPNNPRFPAFPYSNVLTMEYTLLADRVRVSYEVENRDARPMGFGFGIHPFWRIIGSKDQVFIRVPLPYHMDATEMMPSGKLDTVTPDSKWSLLDFKPVSALHLDDVYFGAVPKSQVDIEYRSIGLTIQQRATADFTHVVVYTPDRNLFCVENQTCSTDAHNLFSRGLVKESHLQALKPGHKTGGHVDYIPVWKKE
jgi:aldose 1-epimerase